MDIALRITVIIAILPVRGASTAIPSTAEARLVPAAVRQPMTMPITAILMEAGRNIPAVSTGAKPIAGIAEQRTTTTLRTA